MNTKYCPKCGKNKLLKDFGKQAKNKDGLYPYCRECKKEENKKYRLENNELIKAARKKAYWNNLEHYREYYREYQSGSYREYWCKYMKEHPELNKAHYKVASAIKKGLLEKRPCENCGDKVSEAHHDDYNKPLEVRWLCKKCHMEWHRLNKAIH